MHADAEDFEEGATRVFATAQGTGAVSDEMISHYLPRLRAFVRARISEELRRRESESDIVQSVCRDLVRDRDRLDFGHEAQFRAWLFTAALNKIRHKGRFWGQEKRSANHELRVTAMDDLTAVYTGVVSPSRVASAQEQIERIESALDRLPDEYREVISMSRLANLPHKEIAEQLGKTESASRQLLGRALRRLAEELTD